MKGCYIGLNLGGLIIIIVAAVLIIIQQNVDNYVGYLVVSLLLLIFVLFLGFTLLIFCILLAISALRLFFVLEKPKDLKDLSFYLFKLKLTRNIIYFVIILFPTLFFFVTAAITIVWNDLFTFYYFTIQSYINCVLSSLFTILTTITLIHNENLSNFYCQRKDLLENK